MDCTEGSFQCSATIYMKDGTTYDVAYYTATTTAVLTNGETVTYDKRDRLIIMK